MTEKVIIGNAELWHGDCREILPTLPQFDLILTDPPYGIGRSGQAGMTSIKRGRINTRSHHDDLGWDCLRPDTVVFKIIMHSAIEHIVWGGNYFADLLPPSSKWLVWDKGQRISQSDGELAWTSLGGGLRIACINRCEIGQDADYWRGPSFHPTQKPIKLMSWCLSFAPKSTTVCDPFMGSGTTGVACAQMGKAFTGIERERKYFDIACERIERAQAQGQLLPHEPVAKAEQAAMF